MKEPHRDYKLSDRRKNTRWSVYSFMHATATLLNSTTAEQIPENLPELSWTGLLVDISREGAQITLPSYCAKHFKQGQHIGMQIRTTIKGLTTEVAAQVRSIESVHYQNNVRIGVQFTNIEANKEACDVITGICEYGRKFKAENEAQANGIVSAEDQSSP
ncbi:MAG: PilZ domain-containing protein [Phycisphaerales bacterium]|jgi:hypothetical protein